MSVKIVIYADVGVSNYAIWFPKYFYSAKKMDIFSVNILAALQ